MGYELSLRQELSHCFMLFLLNSQYVSCLNIMTQTRKWFHLSLEKVVQGLVCILSLIL